MANLTTIDCHLNTSQKAGMLKARVDDFQAWPFFITRKDEKRSVLLYSGGDSARARYHILGLKPSGWFKSQRGQVEIGSGTGVTKKKLDDPLAAAFAWLEDNKRQSEPLPFFFPGGALGYFAYDVCRYIEKLPEFNRYHSVPEIYLIQFDELWVYDRQNSELFFIWQPGSGLTLQQASAQFQNALDQIPRLKLSYTHSPTAQAEAIHPKPVTPRPDFLSAVRKAQEYIYNGDIFQVNLSQRFEIPGQLSPLQVFQSLIDINPSPFFAYFSTPEITLCSGSPERLVSVHGQQVETRPIAGTRPRSADSIEDLRLSAELLLSEKERAEHVMLVDLERNDLGRVCVPGSVHVSEMFKIEHYSHVHHIVSNVCGTLRPDTTAEQVFRSVFPGGTITGTPKVRAMEIIAELEPISRGSYTGSLGWFGYNGDLDLNIIIRSLEFTQGQVSIQVGAGIVADSDPQMEFGETLEKAKAMLSAVEWSG